MGLNEKDSVTRRAALEALGKLCNPEDREVISTLVHLIEDPLLDAPDVGAALLQIPATDNATLSSVKELFSHQEWTVRKGSLLVFGLLSIGAVRSDLIDGVVDSLCDESLFVREA